MQDKEALCLADQMSFVRNGCSVDDLPQELYDALMSEAKTRLRPMRSALAEADAIRACRAAAL